MSEKTTFGDRLRIARRNKNLTQKELAALICAKHNSVSNWENDQNKPDPDMIERICEVLDISASYLLPSRHRADDSSLPSNVRPISELYTQRVPMLGEIAAGVPIMADEDYETFVDAPIRCDFALTVRGESMVPNYLDGDVVYIRRQDDVDDGQVAAVVIDGDATLKHVYHIPNGVQLVSDNPAFPPMLFTLPGCDTINILGRVVGFTRMFADANPLRKVTKGMPIP